MLVADCCCGAASEVFKFFKGEVERDRRRIEELQRLNEALEARLRESLPPPASLLQCDGSRRAVKELLKANSPQDVIQSLQKRRPEQVRKKGLSASSLAGAPGKAVGAYVVLPTLAGSSRLAVRVSGFL